MLWVAILACDWCTPFGVEVGTTESQNASNGPPRMPKIRKRERQPNAARMMGDTAKPMRLPAAGAAHFLDDLMHIVKTAKGKQSIAQMLSISRTAMEPCECDA